MMPIPPRQRLVLTVFVATLAGCATPQYQNRIRMVPPAGAAGQQCVNQCESKKTACQTECRTQYEACARSVEPQVEARYTEALKQYENDLKAYAAALRRYELQMHFDWFHAGYPYRHPRRFPYGWDPFPGSRFPPPAPEPSMPTRESVRDKLVASSCKADCGCLPAYDGCFVACGGQRIVDKVCVENCRESK